MPRYGKSQAERFARQQKADAELYDASEAEAKKYEQEQQAEGYEGTGRG